MPDQPSPSGPPTAWPIWINALAGSVVLTVGLWMSLGGFSPSLAVVAAIGFAAFLVWRGTTPGRVWAWATLLVGLESLAWPVLTMIRVRMETAEPTDQQMGDMLTSVLFGLFSAVFWISFAYGIVQWTRKPGAEAIPDR